MKVRLLAPFPPPFGGVALHGIRLLEGLRQLGMQATGISQGGVPAGVDGVGRLGLGFFFSRTLVHYHTDEGNHRWMRLLSFYWWLTRTPYVVTVHSFRDRPEFTSARVRRSLARAYRRAKAVICISDAVVRDLDARIGVRHKLTRTIPSTLPVSQWEHRSPMSTLVPDEWKGAPVRLLANAGRIVTYEGKDLYGIDVLVDAMSLITETDVRLCIAIGDVVDRSRWAPIEQRIMADQRITVIRNLNGPLAPMVAHAHVIIRPTRTEGGPSLTLSESLELGRWSIGSDSVPRPDGTVLFRNEDPADLARALGQCIGDVRKGLMPPVRQINSDAVQKIVNLYQRVTSDK
ncbi:MAG: glycosyltransferase family 4 protein [Candidatus Kapabacteria bacterium]|nr:glycosyltransferase family 4 protein [Candidatus Kapabacteria bacterium]